MITLQYIFNFHDLSKHRLSIYEFKKVVWSLYNNLNFIKSNWWLKTGFRV